MIFDCGTGWQVDLPDGQRWWADRAKGWTHPLVEEAVQTFLQFTPTDCCMECGRDTTGEAMVCQRCYNHQVMENDRLLAEAEER